MIGRLLSASLFALSSLMAYLAFGFGFELVTILAFLLLSPLWEPIGYVGLSLLGVLLVYRSVGGFLGIITLIFAIEYVESVGLAKRKAPAEHYYVLFAGTLLAVPIYYFVYLLSFHAPSLVNTAVSAVFIVLLYVLFYMVVKR